MATYRGTHFTGKDVIADTDFIASLNRVNKYAGECNVKVWVTSSIRNINQQLKGAIVRPASRSCHYVGHAIDVNVLYNEVLYNSKKLRKSSFASLPDAIVKFIEFIRADKELRWGGDFNTQDPVHIDDNLFRRQEVIYLAKLNSRLDQLNT
ncbi:hypothetical protein MNBD_GAMMA09-3164 [hydrothermal vent metagenome]|uniref:Peptidase M15C domain-containing protein n=1 Tax=hydrothermal vent metagenome TaxID=652676 RepID=A0A3B0XLS7_9ZZZZ